MTDLFIIDGLIDQWIDIIDRLINIFQLFNIFHLKKIIIFQKNYFILNPSILVFLALLELLSREFANLALELLVIDGAFRPLVLFFVLLYFWLSFIETQWKIYKNGGGKGGSI